MNYAYWCPNSDSEFVYFPLAWMCKQITANRYEIAFSNECWQNANKTSNTNRNNWRAPKKFSAAPSLHKAILRNRRKRNDGMTLIKCFKSYSIVWVVTGAWCLCYIEHCMLGVYVTTDGPLLSRCLERSRNPSGKFKKFSWISIVFAKYWAPKYTKAIWFMTMKNGYSPENMRRRHEKCVWVCANTCVCMLSSI